MIKVRWEFPDTLVFLFCLKNLEYKELNRKGTLIGRNLNLANVLTFVPEDLKRYKVQIWIEKVDKKTNAT